MRAGRWRHAVAALVTALVVYVVLGGDVFEARHLLVFSGAFLAVWLGVDAGIRRWKRPRVAEDEERA